MLTKLRRHLSYANVMSTLAAFLALAGGSAYAINEWNSSNIQNETLLSEDIKNGTLQAADYGIGSVSGARIQDNNVTTLDLADGAIFGNDVSNESLTSADVANLSLQSHDLNDNSAFSRHIANGALNDEDIGEHVFVDFAANIGTVPAQSCIYGDVTGGFMAGDHLLLTPSTHDSSGHLIYGTRFRTDNNNVQIQTCNPTGSAINDGTTHFNLLVIDAR